MTVFGALVCLLLDASFSNSLDHLHFAAMGLVEAQRNQFVFLTDTIYTEVRGARHPRPVVLGREA